jgi:hypothetical protein
VLNSNVKALSIAFDKAFADLMGNIYNAVLKLLGMAYLRLTRLPV